MNALAKWISLFLILVTATANGQTPHKAIAVDTIPFILTDHNNISIAAVLNGADTINLMFHSAASGLNLTTAATEKIESIQWSQSSEVESWGGASEARFSKANTLKIGSHSLDSLGIWESQNSGPGTDGKFGPDLFEGYAIEINFDQRALIIHSSLPELADFTRVPLRNDSGFMFIAGLSTINEYEIEQSFLIHTGYGGTVLFDDQFVSDNDLGEKIEIVSEQELKDSYGNVLKTKRGLLETFTIGGEAFHSMPVGFFEGAIGRQKMSVIGGNLLKRFNLVIDVERQNIYLQPSLLKSTDFSVPE